MEQHGNINEDQQVNNDAAVNSTQTEQEISLISPRNQKPTRSLALWISRIQQTEMPEFISLVISLLAILTIVALLLILNGQPTPAWTRKFSLNGVISLLGTNSALGITGNAQGVIGQLGN
jgi:hypothetical protein